MVHIALIRCSRLTKKPARKWQQRTQSTKALALLFPFLQPLASDEEMDEDDAEDEYCPQPKKQRGRK